MANRYDDLVLQFVNSELLNETRLSKVIFSVYRFEPRPATHRGGGPTDISVKVYRLFEGLVVFKKYSLEALISSNREIQGVLDLFFLSIFPTFYS